MTAFSWKNAQKRNVLLLKKQITHCEKTGQGEECMKLKMNLKKLNRRIELEKQNTDDTEIRLEVRKIG